MVLHGAAVASGRITPIETHWIWQDGQQLSLGPMKIVDGCVVVPQRPGLWIEIDIDALETANSLYRRHGLGAREGARDREHEGRRHH